MLNIKIKIIYFCILFLMHFAPSKMLNGTQLTSLYYGNNSSIKERSDGFDNTLLNPPPSYDYYQKNFLRFGDFVYHNNIKTVLFNRRGWEFSPAIIELNTQETLLLQFDDLDADYKNYSYTIIHCDALWNPSNLMDFEYIDGFNQDQIVNYSFSRNTRVGFTHYWLEFPNANMRPRLSGNYILKIFEGSPENVVITRKFRVFEQRVSIEASVRQATDLTYRNTMQEIDFVVNTARFPIANPYQNFRVIITQNGRWDNAIQDLKPRMIQEGNLLYDYEEGNLFFGGNEFRSFDIKSLRYRSLRIAEIKSVLGGWEVVLLPDLNRRFMHYTSDRDINGRYLVKTDDFNDDVLESDYVWVNFTLPFDQPLATGNLYVMGELTDWNFTHANRMEYNYYTNQYELRLLLKQGFYNYKYAFLADGSQTADITLVEGSHSITENDYTIYVYYRRPGDVYDSLIGIKHINSAI